MKAKAKPKPKPRRAPKQRVNWNKVWLAFDLWYQARAQRGIPPWQEQKVMIQRLVAEVLK